jgi:hypothetical protein
LATVAGANAVTDRKAGDGSDESAEGASLSFLETRRVVRVDFRAVEGKEEGAVAGDVAAVAIGAS